MPSITSNHSGEARLYFEAIYNATREMTAVDARAIAQLPQRENLLARPYNDCCRICHFPGHDCDSIWNANACRLALTSTICFWEDMIVHIKGLCNIDSAFFAALSENYATYEMRLDSSPLLGTTFEEIFANRLTRNYLKFQNHYARIRSKAEVILSDFELGKYDFITRELNYYLLRGATRKYRDNCLFHL